MAEESCHEHQKIQNRTEGASRARPGYRRRRRSGQGLPHPRAGGEFRSAGRSGEGGGEGLRTLARIRFRMGQIRGRIGVRRAEELQASGADPQAVARAGEDGRGGRRGRSGGLRPQGVGRAVPVGVRRGALRSEPRRQAVPAAVQADGVLARPAAAVPQQGVRGLGRTRSVQKKGAR